MKIAIDISPLQTGHSVRGTGFYLHYLKEALTSLQTEHTFSFFTDVKSLGNTIDLIHFPYFDPFQRTLPLIKKQRTVVTIHDLTPIVFPKLFPVGIRGRVNWKYQQYLLRKVDKVITDSESSTKDITYHAGVPKKKVSSVYLAPGKEFRRVEISKREKDQLVEKYQLPERFVLYVGDVTPNKNLPRLIRAVKKLGIPLVMVGKALAERDYDRFHPWNRDLVTVHQLAEDDNNIHILGFIPTVDLVLMYNSASVFIMPSLYEGFGLPILEAMACGAPVITTHEGSLPEVAGNAAMYVHAYDEKSIAEGIMKLYQNDMLQKKLSRAGIERARDFSWEKTAEETIHIYEKALI